MSARKLQQEMERVFKRVQEGCSSFETIYNKLMRASNQTQKEKLESDLKREIKKLQKLRDQIKTWIANNDIRDKNQLVEHRKLIENDMERFKTVEREVKTKAYSKEGLMRQDDPYDKEKQATIDFVSEQIEALEQQMQELEQEEDSLQSTNKRGKKDTGKQERINEIDFRLDRHKFHIQKMEAIIDMIERDKLAPESVNDLQDDILYYVESNQDVDFAEDEQLYDELNLEAEDEGELVETIVRDDTYTLEDLAQDLSKEAAKEQKEKDKREKERQEKAAKELAEKEKLDRENAEKDAQTAQAQAQQQQSRSQSPTHQGQSHPPAPVSSSTSGSNTTVSSPTIAKEKGITPLPPPSVPASKNPVEPKKGSHLAQGGATATFKKEVKPVPVATANSTPTITPKASIANLTPSQLPPQLHTNISHLGSAKERLLSGKIDSEQVRRSYFSAPDSVVSNNPSYYHPQNPYPTPEYYPQHPLKQVFDERVFSEMHVDTLFYVFYYCQGTHQQYLAANELKKRTWRFHKQFLTWFQRQEDPKVLTNEYEEGTYRFFDFEGSWVQRRKQDFKFEFKYLE